MIKARGVAFFAILFCCYTINAQLITTPTLQQQGILQQVGTLTSTPTLQTGTLNNSVTNPSLSEAGGPCGIEQARRESSLNDPNFTESSIRGLQKLIFEVDSIVDHRNRFPNRIDYTMIPVVFHYFYDECAPGHPQYESGSPSIYSNERFENAVRILNEDFNAITSSSDPDVGAFGIPQVGSRISFRLAEVDPNGNPTTGINLVKNGLTHTGVGDQNDLRQVIQWPRNTYLNVYIVERINSSYSSGIARFPEQSDDRFLYDEKYDGVAVARWALDPTYDGQGSVGEPIRNDYRATLSHEVGHWLGLRHVWGDENEISGNDYCLIDDFDFYNSLMDSPYLMDENDIKEFTYSLTELDDTPPTNKPGDDWRICSHIDMGYDGCGNNDHDFNIMDYSGCRVLFTNGQKKYMEAVMCSSLSQRNEIKDNNKYVFPNLSNNPNIEYVTYSSYNDPINTSSVVFSRGSICYESESNNGTVENVLPIELRGGETNPFKFLESWVQQDMVLYDAYYRFEKVKENENEPTIIVNLDTEISINTDFQSATLTINGNTEQSLKNLGINKVKIIFDHRIFSEYVEESMRSKIIKFDFIEDDNMLYSFSGGNEAVGPNSNIYDSFKVEVPYDFDSEFFFGYFVGKYGLAKETDIGFGLDNNGLIRTFSKGDLIQVNNLQFDDAIVLTNPIYSESEIKFREINVDFESFNEGEFYVVFKINTCNRTYYGWVRFKVNPDCEEIIACDSGVSYEFQNVIIEAGYTGQQPNLIVEPSIIRRVHNVESTIFKSSNIRLLPGNSSLKFSSQINNNFNVSVIYPTDLTIEASDLEIIRHDDYNVEIKPASTSPIWEDRSAWEIRFQLEFNSNAFLGDNEGLTTSKIYISREKEKYSSNIQSIEILPQQDFVVNTGSAKGFARYNNGYTFWSGNGNRTEVVCEPNSNNIKLFLPGETVSDNLNFKFARGGHVDNMGALLDPDGLVITDATITSLANQSRYLVYRRVINCETYYTWLKLNFNFDLSISYSEFGESNINNQPILTGFIPITPDGCTTEVANPASETDSYIFIRNFIFNEGTAVKVSTLEGETNYSDFTNEPLFDINLNDNYIYNFKLEFEGLHGDAAIDQYGDGSPGNPIGFNKTYSAGWLDVNKNGSFEADEEIFNDQNEEFTNNFVEFSHDFSEHEDDLFGIYTIRIITSVHPIQNGSGCRSIAYGEIEDHSFNIAGSPCSNLNYQNELSINEGGILAESITISADSNLGFKTNFLPNSNNSWVAESICISPYTEIHFGSVFLAEAIEDCGTQILKQTQPNLQKSTIKIYPNPFHEQSTIEFELQNDTEVSIFVSDITGKKLATLASNEQKAAGIHQVNFNAKGIAPGIYYCTMRAGDKIETQKMVITK